MRLNRYHNVMSIRLFSAGRKKEYYGGVGGGGGKVDCAVDSSLNAVCLTVWARKCGWKCSRRELQFQR